MVVVETPFFLCFGRRCLVDSIDSFAGINRPSFETECILLFIRSRKDSLTALLLALIEK